MFSCDILNKAYNLIFIENVDDKLFNKYCKKNNNVIKKASMIILLTTIIYNKKMVEYNSMLVTELINKIRLTIIYHLLCDKKYLSGITPEQLIIFQSSDKIENLGKGSIFVDNFCDNIKKKEPNKIFCITSQMFYELLTTCIKCSIQEIEYESVNKKRRLLNLLDKILLSNFYNRNIPNKLLLEKYSNEHITPFSSSWKGFIDIERIGNLIPTLERINCSRGNKGLSIYKNKENDVFYQGIKNLLPCDNYSEINKYENGKTRVISIEKYNEYCLKNESEYIKNLIDDIFT